MQDDISRGPVPTREYMKSQVRRCAELKLNMLSYYTEHIVKTKSHGDFASAGGGISIDEWKELSDYAAKYYIEIVGNFQSLGHFKKILSYPQYAPLGETKQMLSPIRPESFQLLSDIYAEMAPVFSSNYFNVNCDETWDLGRGESKQQVDSLGIGRVYANHINRIHGELVKYNKRTLVWGDIILSNPEIMDMIPEDIVLGAWTYGADDPFLSYFMPFIENEFEFMFSCGVLNSNRLLPDYRMTMANIKNFVRTAASHGTLGMLCTVWDDGGNAFFPLDWYGVAYAADQSWNVNDDHMEQFDKRFDRGIYGNLNGSISETFQSLIPLTDLSPTQEMNEQVLWKRIIPLRGEHIQLGGTDWYTVKEVIKQAEKKLAKANPVVYKADLNYLWLIIKEYDYMAQSRFELLRASQLYHNASFTQRESRKKAESDARKALDILSALREELINIKETYAELWRLESRIYWLDHLMEAFNEKIYDYIHAEKLLVKSIADLSQGEYLSPPNEIRLDITEHGGQYFQYWLLCGPFPNIMGEGKSKDYLAEIGGELKAKPIPGLSFSSDNGEKKRWMKYSSPIFSKIDLRSVYEENTRVVAYAYCRIESPGDKSVRATFGSNDGIQLILNGDRIYKKFIKRSLILDEDELMLPLKKGRNDLLVKIDQNKGGWGFSFRLPDVNVRNHKHKYRIVD
jgi:hexosaminidase